MFKAKIMPVRNSGLNAFAKALDRKLDEILMEVREEAYLDVNKQLSDHLNSREATGRLKRVIQQSSVSQARPQRDGNIRWIGIGHLPTLDEAPYWKFLEYGTEEQGQGEWPLGEPYRPADSPLVNLTGDETKYKEFNSNLKGIPPNRAWRLALWNSKARLKIEMALILSKGKTRRRR